MMPYYYHNNHMEGWGLLAFLLWLAVLVDLVLLGIWLWQRIKKN